MNVKNVKLSKINEEKHKNILFWSILHYPTVLYWWRKLSYFCCEVATCLLQELICHEVLLLLLGLPIFVFVWWLGLWLWFFLWGNLGEGNLFDLLRVDCVFVAAEKGDEFFWFVLRSDIVSVVLIIIWIFLILILLILSIFLLLFPLSLVLFLSLQILHLILVKLTRRVPFLLVYRLIRPEHSTSVPNSIDSLMHDDLSVFDLDMMRTSSA